MLYRRGDVWWYKFRFAGRVFRESAKTHSKTLARQAERKRHQNLEEAIHGIRKRVAPVTFSTAAADWLKLKKPTLAARSYRIEEINIDRHLKPVIGSLLLIDITVDDIAEYQKHRLGEGAAAKTINLELGTLRALLRRHRLWANLQPDVKMLPVRDGVGKALSGDEEEKLLTACAASRSRALHPAVTLALHTGMRRGEIQSLTWGQVGLKGRWLTVGHSKTDAGRGARHPVERERTEGPRSLGGSFPKSGAGAFPLRLRTLRHRGKRPEALGLRHRSDEANQESQGGMGVGEEQSRSQVPLPRSATHNLHTHGGAWRATSCCRVHFRLEHGHDRQNGASVRAHWTVGAGRRRGPPRRTTLGGETPEDITGLRRQRKERAASIRSSPLETPLNQ